MVINVGALKSGDLRTVERDIEAVAEPCRECGVAQQGDHRGGAAHRRGEGHRLHAGQGGRRRLREDLDRLRQERRDGRRRRADAPRRRRRRWASRPPAASATSSRCKAMVGGRRQPRRRQRRRQDRPRVARRSRSARRPRATETGAAMDDPRATTERRQTPRDAIPSRFLTFSRAEWAPLRANTPLTLSDADLTALRGLNDVLSMEDVVEIYLPLSRLLSLYVQGTRTLHGATSTFLGDRSAKTPFIIGLAGSVAVGKSTTARILQALLSRWPDHPARRPDHDRRLPAAEPHPRGARPDAAQGLPRELRPRPPGAVPGRREVGRRGGQGAGLLARPLRHRARAPSRRCGSRTSSSSKA